MFKKRLAAITLMVALSVSVVFPSHVAYATESEETASESEDTGEKTEKSDSVSGDDEDIDRNARLKEIEDNIKEKQDQIDKAEKDKKAIKDNISNMNSMIDSLEKEKGDLSMYVSQLDSKMEDVEANIEELTNKIEQKENEILETEVELEEAQRVQLDQYNAMKARIKFMYEKGDTYYLELIFNAKNFGDMINKADYIEKLSSYDKSKLQEYVEFCEYVEACKLLLESEKESLDEAKASVEEEKSNLETLIGEKEKEITAKEYDISNKEQAIKEYEADLAEQTAIIKALEAAVAEQKQKLMEESGEVITYDGGMFKFPAPSYTRVSDEFGWRTHPILGVQQYHNGVDLASPGGSPILAAYDGEVVAAAYTSTMGNYVMINHGNDLYTIYMHASKLYVSQGERVTKGQKIAAVGSTGRSTGNHLHFSVRKNGEYVNPWNYLK